MNIIEQYLHFRFKQFSTPQELAVTTINQLLIKWFLKNHRDPIPSVLNLSLTEFFLKSEINLLFATTEYDLYIKYELGL